MTQLVHPTPRPVEVFGGSLGCVSISSSHVVVGTFVNSRAFNSRPRLPGTQNGSAAVYTVPGHEEGRRPLSH